MSIAPVVLNQQSSFRSETFIPLLKELSQFFGCWGAINIWPLRGQPQTFRTSGGTAAFLSLTNRQFFSKITSAIACSVVWAIERCALVAPDCS
jgi:hypothetical protein